MSDLFGTAMRGLQRQAAEPQLSEHEMQQQLRLMRRMTRLMQQQHGRIRARRLKQRRAA